MTEPLKLTRREIIKQGGTVMAGMAFLPTGLAAELARIAPQEAVIPWMDPQQLGGAGALNWESVNSWITPNDEHFRVSHYGTPEVAESEWSLEVTGLVDRPRTLSLDDIKSLPRREVTFSLECAGNRGFPSFWGAIYNARFGGTPLAPLLRDAGIQDGGIEVVFIGTDTNDEEIRGNTVNVNFGRSMTVEDAMDENIILCYEVNGEPLTTEHGFPLRLIAPGWYGVANVKWLKRIEVRPTRYMGRFMAQDYVTLRGEERNGETVYVQTSVGLSNVNSIPAKVTVDEGRHRVHGAAWGRDIERVEVRIDDGPWQRVTLGEGQDSPFTWVHWQFDWDAPNGEHSITSRAIATDGTVQPTPDDPVIADKLTYWEGNGQVTRRVMIA